MKKVFHVSLAVGIAAALFGVLFSIGSNATAVTQDLSAPTLKLYDGTFSQRPCKDYSNGSTLCAFNVSWQAFASDEGGLKKFELKTCDSCTNWRLLDNFPAGTYESDTGEGFNGYAPPGTYTFTYRMTDYNDNTATVRASFTLTD